MVFYILNKKTKCFKLI